MSNRIKTDTSSRTFIGSVVCVDLVGYSKRSVAQQGTIKAAFNKILVQSLKGVPVEDRIVLDTGDGAAISFLGDPEMCLAVGLKLREACDAAAPKLGCAEPAEKPVRIGINLGPVKLAVDMNGHPNIIGDGMNVAERICGFANPGQIVVSRQFHDIVSRISDDHAKLFHYEGLRTDKNVREHEIYSVQPPAGPAPAPVAAKAPAAKAPPAAETQRAVSASATAAAPPSGESAFGSFLRDPAKFGIAAAALVGLIGLLGWLLMNRASPQPETSALAPPPTMAPAAPAERSSEASKAAVPEAKTPRLAAKPEVRAPEPTRPAPPLPPATKPAEVKPPELKTAPPAAPAKPIETKPIEAKPAPPPAKAPEAKAPPPPPAETKAKPAEARPEPKKPPERKAEEPRVIPAPRTPPAQIQTAPQPAPIVAPTEPVPPVREEAKPAPPALAAPTRDATPVSRSPVNFPVAAITRGIERGVVRARLTINAAGSVTAVRVVSSDPPRIFDREATRSLEEWKFNPGADNRSYDIEIEFKR